MTNKDIDSRLSNVFEDQKIPKSIKDFWISRLRGTPQQIQIHIVGFFEAFPQEIAWFTTIQELKERALLEGDKKVWEAILHEEETRMVKLAI